MSTEHLHLQLRSYSDQGAQHAHDYHQLVLPLQGCLTLSVEAVAGEVSASRAAVIPAGCRHVFSAAEANRFVVADVPIPLAPELEALPPFVELDSALEQYVRFLSLQLGAGGCTQTEYQMLSLLIQLLRERRGERSCPDRRVLAARTYMDEHYHRRITASELAAVAHLSVRQLNALFRDQLGVTPHQYLVERRMQQAWQLLTTSDLSIQTIAERVGYGSLSSFSVGFSRHFDRPPSYFRRKSKQQRQSQQGSQRRPL